MRRFSVYLFLPWRMLREQKGELSVLRREVTRLNRALERKNVSIDDLRDSLSRVEICPDCHTDPHLTGCGLKGIVPETYRVFGAKAE